MGARPVVKSVSMSVWAPWVPTWVVSIKITKRKEKKQKSKENHGINKEETSDLAQENPTPRRNCNDSTASEEPPEVTEMDIPLPASPQASRPERQRRMARSTEL
ncbi:hypothetical protein TNCV_971221 [Trichonephila clavipes]|nr:hypothetical protein TNCV_971221 [Trichonephila clavipes]